MSAATDKLTAFGKTHGPAAGVAAVVATIAVLATRPDDIKIAPTITEAVLAIEAKVKPAAPAHAHEGQETRLVGCGRGARVTGDDGSGTIMLGEGADGRCTLLFAGPLDRSITCAVSPGHAAKLTTTDLVIESIDGQTVTYRCGAPR